MSVAMISQNEKVLQFPSPSSISTTVLCAENIALSYGLAQLRTTFEKDVDVAAAVDQAAFLRH